MLICFCKLLLWWWWLLLWLWLWLWLLLLFLLLSLLLLLLYGRRTIWGRRHPMHWKSEDPQAQPVTIRLESAERRATVSRFMARRYRRKQKKHHHYTSCITNPVPVAWCAASKQGQLLVPPMIEQMSYHIIVFTQPTERLDTNLSCFIDVMSMEATTCSNLRLSIAPPSP